MHSSPPAVRFLAAGAVFAVMFGSIHAQTLQKAPLNPEFLEYQRERATQKSAVAPDAGRFGYIPPPVDFSHLRGRVPAGLRALQALPSVYDLRTLRKLTPIRNQDPYGTCWAFATYGSLESWLLPTETNDFSENNLANLHGFDLGYNAGGQHLMSAAYLSRWAGPVNEADDPYSNGPSNSPPNLTVRKHVQEVLFLPLKANALDNTAIKQAVTNYGAMYVSMYYADASYHATNFAYYYTNSIMTNGEGHAVAIVGWNDDYPATNFNSAAPAAGAFIVRNSWGTNWGEQGYFYCSYYDTAMGYRGNVAFNNGESVANYNSLYQYDPLGWVNSCGYTSTNGWGANIFTATNNESLRAVGFYTTDIDARYEIYIYRNITAGNPRSGTLELTQTGVLPYSGYHTVVLTAPVTLVSGQLFSVVIRFVNSADKSPIAYECVQSNYSSRARSSPGQSYTSGDGSAWADMTTDDPTANVCIKAYAGGTRRALLVGINEYDPAYGQSSLPSCINDVQGVRDTILLADPGQRWSASSIQVLTNNLATRGAIRAALQSLATVSQSGDLVLYGHSSHGGQYSGTSVYLCAYDQDYSAVNLGQDLTLFNSGVTVIVLVDACHSGGLFKQQDGWPFAEMTMRAYTEAKTKQYQAQGLTVPKELGNNIAFMTACDYSQTCLAGDPYSLYIGTVITGCVDSAVDANRDGFYQFSELHTYAARLASQNNPNQTAQMFHESILTSMVARSVGSVVVPTMTAGDFDGDRKADPAIYQESSGRWILLLSGSSYARQDLGGYLGGSGYLPVTADYDGDGKADPAVYQTASGDWRIKLSGSSYGMATVLGFGGVNYTPLVADFDGDGKADPAIVQNTTGNWEVQLSGDNYLISRIPNFGGPGYTPLTADYDGDGKADPAVYQESTGNWYVKLSANNYIITPVPGFGAVGYRPVTADFDGDRKADPAVQNPATGMWYIQLSADSYAINLLSGFGGAGYGNAFAADYDGDGKADPGLYRSAAGLWYFRLSGSEYGQATAISGYTP